MKKLDDLIPIDLSIEVLGITDDSRLVKKDFLFVATKGFNVDHYDYIDDAIKNGCCFVVCDRKISYDIPYYIVDNINEYYMKLCEKFYDVDLSNKHFIGITGTDGKTTTATIIHELINNCCYIGTNGFIYNNRIIPTNNTTPCVSDLYSYFNVLDNEKIDNVSMEVSSEALLHGRVNNILFDIIGFTNVTGDHLNIHTSFNEYLNCKLKLLNLLKKDGIVIINGDDVNLHSIKCKNMYTFGFDKNNDFVISSVKQNNYFVNFTLSYNSSYYEIFSPFIGIHNVYNVTMAFIVAYLYGVDPIDIISKIKILKPISGRCEFLNFGQKYDIVLDYAHTINGISNILKTFSNYKKIITVTGCAGGRDTSKRSEIGKIVMHNSDISIFTMDDPRYESVDKIIDEMVGDSKNYLRIIDRKEAIYKALAMANDFNMVDCVVLILGKGRDSYMAIENKKIPYNDYEVIKSFFDN